MPKLVLVFSFLCFLFSSLSAAKAKKGEEVPQWLQDPNTMYSSYEYLTNLGQGKTQKQADSDALEGISAIFNRSIASNTQSSLAYSSIQSGGSTEIEKSKSIKQDVKISTNMKELIGVEIKERWKSKDGTFYALAVIEKSNGARLYREKASLCIADIDKLLDAGEGKGGFAECFRCYEASKKAQTLQVYKGCVAVLDEAGFGVTGRHRDDEYSPVALKVRAESIAKGIEIYVDASPEAKKLKPHIEKLFSKHNFTLSKDSSARYKLVINLELDDPMELSKGRIAIRYSLQIELFDTKQDETVLPFALEGKETHFDVNSVKSKILKALEKKAVEGFSEAFAKFAMPQSE